MNLEFKSFYNNYGIQHEFSASKTPQKNGIVEKNSRSIQEIGRLILTNKNLYKHFLK